MNVQVHLPEPERLRLLGIMGVDVYVPRTTPLARAVDVAPVHAAATRRAPTPAAPATARVLIRGVGADEHPNLLAAVMRGARLRREDWAHADGSAGALPEWRFGQLVMQQPTPPALALPAISDLRDSVSARREAWRTLRTWLRRP